MLYYPGLLVLHWGRARARPPKYLKRGVDSGRQGLFGGLAADIGGLEPLCFRACGLAFRTPHTIGSDPSSSFASAACKAAYRDSLRTDSDE